MSDDHLDAGLEAGYERGSRAPGESVLAAIERLHGARSQVALREVDDGATPVALRRDDAPAVDDSRYQILGEVARGGVGLIYRGRDKNLNRDVALKVLRHEHAQSPDVVQRFIEEAQVGGQLQHPGIVPVYGMGLQPDGRAYFAMKFIKGRTLSALLDSNPQGYDPLAIFEQLALAMAYAHSRGVIHRDLKPANVMVGSFGEVIVVDWGFAKVLGVQELKERQHTVIATVRSEAEGSQSMAGSVMGTPAYMPPEQAMGLVDELDERSDVFALGAILCEILTGEPPYTGGMRDQLLAAAQCRLDDAHARLDACDAAEEIKKVARDCMQPMGEDRPADAGVVARRLTDHFAAVEERVREAELATIGSDAAAELSRSARRRTMILAAVALVAILVSGGGYLAWNGAREREHADAERRVAAALEESARFERDGDLVAAISAAEKAVAVAEADESDASDARATLERLQSAEAERQSRKRMDAKLALVFAQIEKVFELPQDERYVRLDAACTKIVARHFGPGERGLDALAKLANGSELATRIAERLYEWSSYCAEPRATQLFELALRIDSSHAEWRRAAKEDPARLVELFDQRGIEGLPSGLVADIALHLTNQRRREEAWALLRGMVWRRPESTHLRWSLGWTALALGSIEEGRRVLFAGTVVRPELKSSNHNHATALQYAGRFEEAERAWRAVTERFPDWSHAYRHHAQVLVRLGRKAEARVLARAMLERHPEDEDWLCTLASVTDDVEQQLDLQRRSVNAGKEREGEGQYSSHYQCLARALHLAGRDEEAIAALRRARELGARPGYWASIITLYLEQDDLVAATEAARATLAFQHYRQAQWVWMSSVIPQEMDRDAAVAWWRELVESSPESAGGWLTLGQLQLNSERLAEARASADRALALDNQNRASIKLLADLHRKEGRFDEAEAAYRRALEIGEWDQVWHYLGILLYQDKNDVTGADAAFARAVELAATPTLPLLHQYAQTRTDLGDPEQAIELYRRADRIQPGNNETITKLGNALASQGRYDEALRLFEGKEEHLVRLVSARFLSGDVKGAIDAAEKVIAKKGPAEGVGWYWLGRARGSLGDHGGAVAALERAILLGGTRASWDALARELRKARSKAELRAELHALVDRCPNRDKAMFDLFHAYFDNGDFDSRTAYARQLAASDADKAYGLYEQALVHWQFHEHEQALATLAKIPAALPAGLRSRSQQLRVQVLSTLGRYDDLPALLDALSESGIAKAVRREAALAKRIPAMVDGRDAPKDPAEAFESGVVCCALRRYEEAVFFYRQSGLAGHQLQYGVGAAVPAGDPIAKVWFRKDLDRLRGRVEKHPGSTRRALEIYKRMPTMRSVRDDPQWRELWAELEALLARAKELTW